MDEYALDDQAGPVLLDIAKRLQDRPALVVELRDTLTAPERLASLRSLLAVPFTWSAGGRRLPF